MIDAAAAQAEQQNAMRQASSTFFVTYLRALCQYVNNADASWRSHLHPDFFCRGADGIPRLAEDHVLLDFQACKMMGTYGSFDIQSCSSQWYSGTCVDCQVVLRRLYRSPTRKMSRDMFYMQIIAVLGEDGRLRVAMHCYSQALPQQISGIYAQSQIGQDLWVLNRLRGLRNGFFLEIGANHPQIINNTYLLEKAAGWSGICVDPFPVGDWTTRSARLIRAAVGPDGGRLCFVAPGHVLGGLYDHVDIPRVMRDVPAEQQKLVDVDTFSLATMLRDSEQTGNRTPKVIHYLSIDTEGSEYEILSGFPFESWTPLSITVEHNFKEPMRADIRKLLEERGFMLDVCVEHDDFFLFKDLDKYLDENISSR